MRSLSSLPAPKPCGRVIESTGPCHQIFHASCREKRAFRFPAVNADIFRICDHSRPPKCGSLRSDCLQTDWTDSCHCGECAAAFFLPFRLVEVRDAFFGNHMTNVVAVDHDGGDWHSCLFANLHRVESFDERRNATFLKSRYGLHHEL